MSRTTDSQNFARAFGDAFRKFLEAKGISQVEAARRLGWGQTGKARLNAYCHDSPKGTRPTPEADVLYLVCVRLGFKFEYNGFAVTAAAFNGDEVNRLEEPAEQLQFEYDGQFDLTDRQGVVSVSFRRPPGRVEVSVSLKAAL